ncbi:hypothetical protein, partial [Bacteroides fragilis]
LCQRFDTTSFDNKEEVFCTQKTSSLQIEKKRSEKGINNVNRKGLRSYLFSDPGKPYAPIEIHRNVTFWSLRSYFKFKLLLTDVIAALTGVTDF